MIYRNKNMSEYAGESVSKFADWYAPFLSILALCGSKKFGSGYCPHRKVTYR